MSSPLVRITVGLPGCGKTTWTRQEIARHLAAGGAPETLVRLSRDDMRLMMTNGYSKPQRSFEAMLTNVIDTMLRELIASRTDVIVDATNLNPRHCEELAVAVRHYRARYELVDFTRVPLETCIARDAQRTGSAHVGEAVIRGMWERWLAPSKSR